ncbi:MAG TPA: hypothetical protein VM821_05655, partial [Abditibacteriaceae bacterium]|nr:hypothetical protein [Abditibacteriaceae bacterium]
AVVATTLFAPSIASSAKAAPAASGLSFDVLARLVSLQNGKASQMPPQTFDARVFVKGRNVRIETELADRPVVFLLSPPHLTKLLPESKAGVRWMISRTGALPGAGSAGLANNLQDLMRNPSSLRAALGKSGAKKTGSGNLNGTLVDIYSASNFMGRGQKMIAWLRRGDALPMRAQLVSKTLSSTLSWRNYKRAALADTMFRAPAGYNVRDSAERPSY